MVGPGTKVPDWVGIPVGILMALFLALKYVYRVRLSTNSTETAEKAGANASVHAGVHSGANAGMNAGVHTGSTGVHARMHVGVHAGMHSKNTTSDLPTFSKEQQQLPPLQLPPPLFTPNFGFEYRVFCTAVILACKYLDDKTYTNKSWSKITGIRNEELNRMEREFLTLLNFELAVPETEFIEWIRVVEELWYAK